MPASSKVMIRSDDQVFSRALRRSLEGVEVSLSASATDPTGEVQLVIWKVGADLEEEELAATAMKVPTLLIGNDALMLAAVDAGCRGFLPESATIEEMSAAVDTILAGGAVVPPLLLGPLLRHLVDRRRRARIASGSMRELTQRERDVFDLAGEGLRREEIAEKLFISPDTVRTHLQSIYRKLGVHSHAELVALAHRIGDAEGEP